jgi:hypothetical protein
MPNGRTNANCPATSTTVVRMKKNLALLIATPLCRPRGAWLEANVLEGFGGPPVQARGLAIVASPMGEIPERDPSGSTVTDRSHLLKAPIGGAEEHLSLV